MLRSCARLVFVCCLLSAAVLGWGVNSTPLLPLTGDEIDLAACRAYADGKPADAPTLAEITGVLGLHGTEAWSLRLRDAGDTRQLLIAFKTPLAVGSLLLQDNARCAYLPAEETLPADALTAKWAECAFPASQSAWKTAVLPPGVTVHALLITLSRSWGDWERLHTLRLFAHRLYNLVPDATANGDAEYVSSGGLSAPTPHPAANITRGAGAWQNAGPDETGMTKHAVISAISPSWFVVSWNAPQTLCALRLASNFRKCTVYAFKGAAGINPAIGGENDWVLLPGTSRDDGDGKWFFFAPLATRGIKFVTTETQEGRYARIDGLHAFTDLGDKAVPVRQVVDSKPPCTFTYTLPADGYVSAAIDDAQGRRVRNLTAREFHKAGPVTFGWDLKDEAGQMAPVGAYHWKLIYSPGLTLKYQMTPYPNIASTTPDNSPWLNGASGPGGWLADHSAPRAVTVAGDKVYISACCCESGVALIECDTEGKKDWGYGNIIAWTGPSYMASDGKVLYTAPWETGTDYVWRFTLPEKHLDTMLQTDGTATRKRGIRGMAVRDGKLYLSINAGTNYLENTASPADVNLETCVPRYPVPQKANRADDPDPRSDFLRGFRLMATPPGNNGLIYLESTNDKRIRQHIVLSFSHPVPVGSLVFPMPEGAKVQMHISVLKATATLPLFPRKDSQWTEIWKGTGAGWMVVPAPPNTLTRAIRLSFDHGQTDVENEGVDAHSDDPDASLSDDAGNNDVLTGPQWQAKLEGMKILRRRFTNLFPSCKVTVSSGKVTPTGEWDAARTAPLTTADPGIYQMTWDTAQHLRGLAIKEIDGKQTDIDAWTGPDGVPVDMHDTKNWTNVASYTQQLRYTYNPDQFNNFRARYIDGYVDFGREVVTRALRLRVVEQWMWKGEGREGCVGVRMDRGGTVLDPTRCRVYGVSPLQYLGDEAPVDNMATERVEVYDTATNHLLKEFPIDRPGKLTNGPNGLYAISDGGIAALDAETGKVTPLKLDVKSPWALTCDHAGNLYIFDGAADQRVVKVFTPAGKPLRTIGTPGGRIAGPWDPTRFSPHGNIDMAIDAKEQLWITEEDFSPKRVSIWSTDGTFKRDLLGNTTYGGGGILDPQDKTRLFYGPMEFALDWQTGATRIARMTWMGDSPAGEIPIRVQGRRYLVTRPNFNRQSVAVVYLEDNGQVKRVAAVGRAGSFAPLRTPDVLGKLGKTPLGDCSFTWTDRNGDGIPQADEVEFFNDSVRPESPGGFEPTLSIDAGGAWRYEATGFTPNGAPIYQRVTKPVATSLLKLNNGNWFTVGDAPDRVVDPAGKTVWTYPSEGWGVHALYSAKPYTPAQVVSEFDVVGHETAHAGDLGEFLVTDTNTGDWHIWTADGLLAGQLFRDLRSGAQPWSMREHARGLDLTNVTVGQEHFAGYFCRTADNKYYAVAGHNHVSVVEVDGIDKFVRGHGDITITPAMLEQAVTWNRQQFSHEVYTQAKLVTCHTARNVEIDGNPREWDNLTALPGDPNVRFGMAYDDNKLYVCYVVDNNGPLKNTGNDWKRLFKTGAAVDLHIGVDPRAAADRTSPAIGDQRLLMTVVNGKPMAVLYQPNAQGAKPADNWETHTDVFAAKFDRVVQAPEVQIVVGDTQNGYCLEAAIPLKTLGLSIHNDLALKFDWGILVSGPQGSEVLLRRYWANPLTAIVSDEAAEAMLHPDLWGTVRFLDASDKNDAPEADL